MSLLPPRSSLPAGCPFPRPRGLAAAPIFTPEPKCELRRGSISQLHVRCRASRIEEHDEEPVDFVAADRIDGGLVSSSTTVRRQHLRDRTAALRKGGFLVHRSP